MLINVVTTNFAGNAAVNKTNLGAVISDFTVDEIKGKKYVYDFESLRKISIDLPFGEYRMLLGINKKYEEIFDQILSSFKFFEPKIE